MSHAASDLLVEDIDHTVGIAAGWSLDVRRRQDLSLVLAIADEGIGPLAQRLIDANVALIVVDGIGRE